MARKQTLPKNRDKMPGLREQILAGVLKGLNDHLGRTGATIGQSGPSTLHVYYMGIHFDVRINQRDFRLTAEDDDASANS